MRNRLGLAAATVALSWWLVALVWGLLGGHIGAGAIDASLTIAGFVAVGVLLGAGGVGWWIAADRQARREELVTHDVRGLVSSIGEVPFLAKAPAESQLLPDLSCPDVPDTFYPRWFARFSSSHPKHVALAKRVLKIYGAHAHLPAGFDGERTRGGLRPHGGRTLVQHAMLCAYKMHTIGRTFDYKGIFSDKGRPLLPLRDPNFKFDPDHPLLMITALAHDIGKIEAFKFDADGQVIGIHREHDLTGARMLARLEETWSLPEEDRMALILAVGHYHAAKHLPLAPDRQAVDDRTVALMELLALADRQASAIEHRGYELTKEELAAQVMSEEATTAVLDPLLAFEAFLSEVSNAAAINSNNKKENMGWLCNVKGMNTTWLAINEENMAAAIARRLGLANYDAKDGSGRREVTIALLGELGSRGMLATGMRVQSTGEFEERSPKSALWKVIFQEMKDGKARDWLGPLVLYFVDPEKVPLAKSVKAFRNPAVVVSGVTGNAGRLARKPGAAGGSADVAQSQSPGGSLNVEAGVRQSTSAGAAKPVDEQGSSSKADGLPQVPESQVGATNSVAESGESAHRDVAGVLSAAAVEPGSATDNGMDAPGGDELASGTGDWGHFAGDEGSDGALPRPVRAPQVPEEPIITGVNPTQVTIGRSPASPISQDKPNKKARSQARSAGEEQRRPLRTYEPRPPIVSQVPAAPEVGTNKTPTAVDVGTAASAAFQIAAKNNAAAVSIHHAQDGRRYAELTLDMLETGAPSIPWRQLRAYLITLRDQTDASWRVAMTSEADAYVLRVPLVLPQPSPSTEVAASRDDAESESAL